MSAGATIIFAVKVFFVLMAVAALAWLIIALRFRSFRK